MRLITLNEEGTIIRGYWTTYVLDKSLEALAALGKQPYP